MPLLIIQYSGATNSSMIISSATITDDSSAGLNLMALVRDSMYLISPESLL